MTAAPFDAVLLVAHQTNMMTLTALVDGMRAANRMANAPLFTYRIVSHDGRDVEASNSFRVPVEGGIAQRPHAEHVFVLASYEPQGALARDMIGYLKGAARRGSVVYGIDQGAVLLARAGLLDGHSATTHWEVLPSLPESHPEVGFVEQLFVFDRSRVTCAGHTACVDLIAHIIEDRFGSELAVAVMQEMIYGRLRHGQERQRLIDPGLLGSPAPALRRAAAIMNQNLEQPIPLNAIAEIARVSRRQLEISFAHHVRCSPARYYLRLRLSLARQLLLYSEMRIVDVSAACGFASQTSFTRAFRREYATTPMRYRRSFRGSLERPIAPVCG